MLSLLSLNKKSLITLFKPMKTNHKQFKTWNKIFAVWLANLSRIWANRGQFYLDSCNPASDLGEWPFFLLN